MKRLIMLSIIVLSSFCLLKGQDAINSDSTSYKKNYLYLNASQTVFYTFQLGYERALINNRHSILFEAGYHMEAINENIITGYTEELQYRLFLSSDKSYPKNKIIFDIYLGPYINHKFYNYETDHLDTHNLIYGLVAGLRFSYYNFVCDLHCGGGYKTVYKDDQNISYNGYQEYADIGFEGFLPKIGIQIGYKF